jgi:CoA-dependent NAD(P)H sulfur oxidoreductase
LEDLVVRPAHVFREKQGIEVRLGHTAQKIDRQARTILGRTSAGDGFQESYDKLLIATGARPRIPDIPGNDLPGLKALKGLEDGRRIKDYIFSKQVREVLIVGTGYIGLEMAETFHSLGIQVHMTEMMPGLLPWLPDQMAEVVRKELDDKGVGVRFSNGIRAVEQRNGKLMAICDSNEYLVDMVLIAAGVVPNSEIAADAGLELGPANAIAVDRFLRTSDADIFSAGDCADAFHVVTGRKVWIPLALRANRSGWAVGDNVTGGNVELPGIVGSAVFKVLDLEVARTGLSLEEARMAGFDPVQNLIQSRSRAHAHPGNTTIHVNLVADAPTGRLLGGAMVGKEGCAHRINALAVGLHAGMTVAEFFQCDLAYAPPFSPVWDPLLTAANQLLRKVR